MTMMKMAKGKNSDQLCKRGRNSIDSQETLVVWFDSCKSTGKGSLHVLSFIVALPDTVPTQSVVVMQPVPGVGVRVRFKPGGQLIVVH
jgi:hypothetical protein